MIRTEQALQVIRLTRPDLQGLPFALLPRLRITLYLQTRSMLRGQPPMVSRSLLQALETVCCPILCAFQEAPAWVLLLIIPTRAQSLPTLFKLAVQVSSEFLSTQVINLIFLNQKKLPVQR